MIIVGGGLAGLRSAQLLSAQKYRVILLEAQNVSVFVSLFIFVVFFFFFFSLDCNPFFSQRVGGRTFGQEFQGKRWDLGGQWIGPTQVC